MKLTWTKQMYLGDLYRQAVNPETGYTYFADGEKNSYKVSHSKGWWLVVQFNHMGTVVKTNKTLTLDGAKARAQTWEDHEPA